MARASNISVALNYVTSVPCAGEAACPPDGVFLYNTDVLFDNWGAVLAVYHKAHIFSTAQALDQAPPRAAVAEVPLADGGTLRVGLAVCFDAEFDDPTRMLLQRGVRHVLLSSYWGMASAAFSPRMFQQGYSRRWEVALVAANGADAFDAAVGGSGIYVRGDVLATIADAPGDGLVVADVPVELLAAEASAPLLAGAERVRRGSAQAVVRRPPLERGVGLTYRRTAAVTPCSVQDGPGVISGSCALMSLADGEEEGDSPRTLSAAASHDGVECAGKVELSVSGGISSAGNAHSSPFVYVLAALSGVRRYPDTPDGLDARACAIVRCAATFDPTTGGECTLAAADAAAPYSLAAASISAEGLCGAREVPTAGGRCVSSGRQVFMLAGEGADGAPLPLSQLRVAVNASEMHAVAANASAPLQLFAMTAIALRKALDDRP